MISAQERRGDAQHNKGDVQVVVEESNLPQRRRILKRSSQRDKDDVQVVVSPSQKRMLKGSSQRCNDVVQVVVEESSLPQKRRMMNGSHMRYRDYSSLFNKKNVAMKSVEGFTYDLGVDQVSTELAWQCGSEAIESGLAALRWSQAMRRGRRTAVRLGG